jgi:hypothetical protein
MGSLVKAGSGACGCARPSYLDTNEAVSTQCSKLRCSITERYNKWHYAKGPSFYPEAPMA